MSLPTMDSNNFAKRINVRLTELERKLKEVRSAIGTLGAATISKGGILVKSGGSIIVDSGILQSRFIFLRGELWPADVKFFNDLDGTSYRVGGLDAGEVGVSSTDAPIGMRSGVNQVYVSHTTTGAAANTVLDAGTGLLQRSTSSRRYKTDIADTHIDLDDARQFAKIGRTWIHTNNIDKHPEGDIRRNAGWIAEEVDQLPSLRQFVNYDPDGRPDSLETDRLPIVHGVLLTNHEDRVTELEATVVEQATQIAALTRRLNKLEGP